MASLNELLGRQKRFGFTVRALPPDTFAVVELSGTEAISRPYVFELTLVSENPTLAHGTVLNQPATLTIYPRTGDPQPVPYHGLVTHLEQAHQIGGYTVYRVVLAPRLWDLSRDLMSEVYLDRTVAQIVALKLHAHGLTIQDYELKLTSPYHRPLQYLCQYQETDLDFIARLMERTAIYFYFEQGPEREKLIILDAQAMQPASVQSVPYRPAAQLETGVSEESLQTWVSRQKQVPRTVALQGYNYRTASLALSAEAEVSPTGKGEVRLYGEAFETPAEGLALATARAQELACREQTFQGEGTATGLRAGFFMALQGHYRADFNARYLVTEVRHEGAQAGTLLAGLATGGGAAGPVREDFYRSACTAIPAAVQFRSERVTPKPVIHGSMTAFVDAEGSGEYAELDDQGRYKVQLPFDKTDKQAAKASAWLRLATPYAGEDHGLHFPLHKGAEVLLSFQDGDLNRPVITAAVPNSLNLNQVTRANQTQNVVQSAGGNMILMEDQKDHEKIRLSSPKGHSTLVLGAMGDEGGAEPYIHSSTTGDSIAISGGRDITVVGWYPPGGQEPTDDTVILPPDLPYGTEPSQMPAGATVEYNVGPYNGLIKGDFIETVTGNFNETHKGTSTEYLEGNVTEIIGRVTSTFPWLAAPANKFELIFGAEQGIVIGPKVDMALVGKLDIFGGVAIDLSLSLSYEIHKGPSFELHGLHFVKADDEIKTMSRQITEATENIQVCRGLVIDAGDRLEITEDFIESAKHKVAEGKLRIEQLELAVKRAKTRVDTIDTRVIKAGNSLLECDDVNVQIASVFMMGD